VRASIDQLKGSGVAELRDSATGELLYSAHGLIDRTPAGKAAPTVRKHRNELTIEDVPEPERETWACTLPLPPTTNNLFINRGKGRVKSPEYRTWQARAATILAKSGKWHGGYPVRVSIAILGGSDWRMNSDIANREKATVDALVQSGVIHDDSCKHVQEVSIRYESANQDVPSVVRVEIR
jgi:Holliday junction resolvase RusA-like endonuclease